VTLFLFRHSNASETFDETPCRRGGPRTYDPSIKVGVGGHFKAGVRHQEAGDVGEARVDVFTHVLQLLVLVLGDLYH